MDYCLAIGTLLKRKPIYPLKTAGLRLYRDLLKVKESLENCFKFLSNPFLKEIYTLLKSTLSDVSEYVKTLQTGYTWIYRTASALEVCQIQIEQAKENLLKLINSFDTKDHSTLDYWKSHMRKVTEAWLDGLFCYLPNPLLPKTNNDLEIFNKKVKKKRRKITGQKKTQNFLRRFGAAVSLLLGLPSNIDLHTKASQIPYGIFRKERGNLFDRELQSKLYKIHRNLEDYLFDLEVRWSAPLAIEK